MISKHRVIFLFTLMCLMCINFSFSQEQNSRKEKLIINRLDFYDYRGVWGLDIAAGSSIINGDFQDPEFEIYFRGGFKYHITSHLNVNATYNKYNLAYKEFYNKGFMSFDLNLELLLNPFGRFTPYLYAGGGYNASNYFEETSNKVQGGFGVEIIVLEHLGLKIFGEYNHAFTDELDEMIAGDTDDVFYRIGLGLNVYFGGQRKREKLSKKIKTVINSNPIVPNN